MPVSEDVKKLIKNNTWDELFNVLEVTTMGLKLYLQTRRITKKKPTWRYWDFIRLREALLEEMRIRNERNDRNNRW